jgi:DNA-binding transcriptional LysR family regulator
MLTGWRTTRRVALTEPGRLFLAEARRTLAQAEEAATVARRAAAGEAGRLRIGYVGGELDREIIGEEPYVLALPARHRLAERDEVALVELAGEPWILPPPRVQSRTRQAVMTACAAAGFVPRVTQVARQMDAIVALVSAGLGLSLVPASAQRVGREGVVFRPVEGLELRFSLAASWRRGEAPPTVASFLATLRQALP